MEKVDILVTNASSVHTLKTSGLSKHGVDMQELGPEVSSFAIKDGAFTGVGVANQNSVDAEVVIDAARKTIIPGFVECHTHLVYGGSRVDEFELKIKGADYLEILESGGGILSTVRHTREASLEELIETGLLRIANLIEQGVTVCEIKTGYGLDLDSELRMLEAIIELDKRSPIDVYPTFLPAHAIPAEWKGKEAEFTKHICEDMIPAAAAMLQTHSKHAFIDVFCEKNAFSLEDSMKVIEAGQNAGFKIKAHVDEFTNLGCASYAIEKGATSIDHLDATNDEEVKMLAESDTVGVVTPTVNFNLGSNEFADARKMIDTGCAIALSTDYNPGSSPTPSLQMSMALSCRYQKLLPSEVLSAATINGAAALDVSDRFGSIEDGKSADFLVLKTDDYRKMSYEFGVNHIEDVFKSGKKIN